MRPKRPIRPPAPPPPIPPVVTPEDLAAINPPEVDKLPAYISPGKFQWKPPLPGPKGDPGAPGQAGAPGAPGATVRPIVPPIATAEIANGAVTPAKLSFTPVARPLTPPVSTAEIADGAVTPTKAAPGFGRYVPLDAPAMLSKSYPPGWDIELPNDIDLSAIVPAGAIAVHLRVQIYHETDLNQQIEIYQNAGSRYQEIFSNPYLVNVMHNQHGIVKIDADRKLDVYVRTGTGNIYLNYCVLGYFI